MHHDHRSRRRRASANPLAPLLCGAVALIWSGAAWPQSGSLAPASIAYGNQTVTTTSAARDVTLANTSASGSFTVNSLSVTDPSRFSIAGGTCGPVPFAIAAGTNCTVAIAFTPTGTGNFAANFSAGTTVPPTTFTPVTVALAGTGTAVPGTLAPASLAFGNQTVTTTSSPQSVTVANASALAAFTVNSLSVTDPSRFPIVGGTCGAVPFTLAAGASCTVALAFTPTGTGNFTANFSVGTTTPATSITPASIALSGTGTAVPGSIAPAALAFGNQTVTTTTAPQSITVANTSATASFTVNGLSITDPTRFPIVGGTCGAVPFTLAAGASCTVALAFTPTGTGNFTANFSVGTTTPATTFTPASIALSGTGTAVPGSIAPAALAFGNQTVTTTTSPQSITVANTSATASFTVNGVSITDPTRFPVVGGTCGAVPFTLGAGASCTVALAFTPTATGTFTANFSVGTTTPATTFTPVTIALSGAGTAVPGTLAPANLAFGNQTVTTTSAPQPITLANTSAIASFTVNTLSVTDPTRFPIVGGSCGAVPFTLGAGASCTVALAFVPTGTGSFAASFSVGTTTPATSFAPTTAALAGTGRPVPAVYSPDSLSFPETFAGVTSAPQPIAIGNADAGATLTITALPITQPTRFLVVPGGSCPPVPFSIAAGGMCTVNIAFRGILPPGNVQATLTATATPASTFTPVNVALGGIGGPDYLFDDGFEEPPTP